MFPVFKQMGLNARCLVIISPNEMNNLNVDAYHAGADNMLGRSNPKNSEVLAFS